MRKTHIAIINVAAHGHVNPTLPVAEELVNRTHSLHSSGRTLRPGCRHYPQTIFRQALKNQTGRCQEGRLCTALPAAEALQPLVLYRTSIKADPKTIKERVNKSDAFVMFLEEAVEVLPQLEELYKDDLPDIVLFDFLALAGKLFADNGGIPAETDPQNRIVHQRFPVSAERPLA